MTLKTKPALFLLVLFVCLGCALGWRITRLRSQEKSASSGVFVAGEAGKAPPATQRRATSGIAVELTGNLRALRGLLQGGLTRADADRRLQEIAHQLRSLPPDVALAVLILLLEEGLDAQTGLAFKVGPGGNLTTAPTLRVWMIDLLGQIDPAEGARYARRIYERQDSADEWALALRNEWRTAVPSGQIAEVRQRAIGLINRDQWAETPSDGFLEAFDLTVATLAWEAVPRLEELLAPSRRSELRRASWVALDRLALETPADFLPLLAQREDWLNTQPLVRAGLLARADLATDRQRVAIESYLMRPGLSAEEGAKFFALVPNVNATVSHNLATTSRVPTLQDAARLDRAALQALQSWQARPEFQRWNGPMTSAEARLRESIAAAARGGYFKP